MPSLTVKNIPDDLYERLKEAAAMHHRSINSELIHCLALTLQPARLTSAELLTAARALRAQVKAETLSVDDIEAAKQQGRK
jgi:plasmid stability protein